MTIDVFQALESGVRSYCRMCPAVFTHASGPYIHTEDGAQLIDFFAGAGALNYGHNHPAIKTALLEYLAGNGITHALDFHTVAKRRFLTALGQMLEQRQLSYKVQFCGPTGTNGVEAALKLARKVTGRPSIFAFMGSFHGMTLGSLAATGSHYHRRGAGVPLGGVTMMPFPGGALGDGDTLAYMDSVLSDPKSGVDRPAAVLVETVQAEGGVIVANADWLRRLAELCRQYELLLIVDDVQIGCGRTGRYFSFERAGIVPDIVVLSKSLSGLGLPLAVCLLRPELDRWE
ncbi:MAG: diaminobutyrate--2-oxoglutarate transaminase, partial [Myxococcota bacterium]